MVFFTFPAPNRPLSENESRRLHWAARHRRLKDWGILAQVGYKHADDKQLLAGQRIGVRVFIPFSRKARRDPHNYVGTVVKTIIDGLIRAGMAPDDTPEFVEVLEPNLIVDSQNVVTVYLHPLGPIQTAPEEKP